MKDRYAEDLHDAFIDAMRSISIDERKLLRSHYLDGLSIEDVGLALHVSRETVAQRLSDVRDAIVTRTLTALKERLAVDASEAESLLELVRSELDPELIKLL